MTSYGQPGGAPKGNVYYYDDTEWKDKLTGINGYDITYDESGNPLSYRDGMTFTWQNGRQLASLQTADNSVSYKYDSNGMRTQKNVDGTKTYYYYDSNKNLIGLTKGNATLLFYYDSNGNVTSFKYGDTMYYYVKNLQGDVVKIINQSGTEVAGYVYDAWGNIKSTSGQPILRELNPFRYRSYVYDEESCLYYLQSRYYDPFVGRFLNADDFNVISMDADNSISDLPTLMLTNAYAYCYNNPIMNTDRNGYITPANIIGAIIGGIIGAVGGYFLTNWLADKLNLSGWKRNVFVWGLTAVLTASAAAIGYFIGPYVAKCAKNLVKKLINLMKKTKGGCFISGTLISTIEGKKAIEDINIGDYVLTQNVNTGEQCYKQVTNVYKNKVVSLVHIYVLGEEIVTTENHPFYVINKGWVEAGDLTESDILLSSNNCQCIIEHINIEHFDYYIDVYNFEVEQFHTYFVGENSIFVHNATCGGMNNFRLLKTTKVKGYRISMDLEKGGSGKNNIHLLVDGVKYYYKNSKFISKAGKEIPKSLRNNSIIKDALEKALYLIKNGW